MSTNYKGEYLSASSSIFKSSDRRLSKKKITEAQADQINALWADAINEFVETAVRSMAVDTGMSVASFEAVAGAVGFGLGSQKIHGLTRMKKRGSGTEAIPQGTKERKGYTTISGQWVAGGTKSAETGRSLGEQAYIIDYVSSSHPSAGFSFEAVVFQHAHMEQMQKSLDKAAKAMESYISDNFSNYYNPLKALRTALNV